MSTSLFIPTENSLFLNLASYDEISLVDKNGKVYYDFTSGYCVNNISYDRAWASDLLQFQNEYPNFVSVYGEIVLNVQTLAAQALLNFAQNVFEQVYFTATGTEAVECAIKIAKAYTGREYVASFTNSYHGSTYLAMSLSGCEEWLMPFAPLPPSVIHLQFNDINSLSKITEEVACVIIEPVQGEAGVVPANKSFLATLVKLCKEKNVILIFDEIQTGFGRCGEKFAFMKYNVIPDILIVGKSLGGGFPLAAILANKNLFDVLTKITNFGHLTTFGGHPVSCMASIKTIKKLEELKPWEYANEFEKIFKDILFKHNLTFRCVGFMGAIDLPFNASQIIKVILQKTNVITGNFLFNKKSIRIYPPLAFPIQLFKDLLNEIAIVIKAYCK